MRFSSIKVRGLIPFPGEISLDIEAIPGQLVCFVGENGSGKSTLLECLAGAMYRETPSRGPLTQLATTRDSLVEARVVNGRAWTLSHRIDAASGKSEARVTGEDGSSVLPDTKVRSFDDWAARTLPAPEVLFASTFSAQVPGGLLRMSPTERKATILRSVGIDKLEGHVADAREWARHVEGRLNVVRARLADERRRAGIVADDITAMVAGAPTSMAQVLAAAQQAVIDAKGSLEIAEVEAQKTDALIEHRRAESARIAQENAAAQAARAELVAAREAVRIADERVRETADRMAMLERELEQADAIRAAANRTKAIDEELRPLREKVSATKAEQQAAVRRSDDFSAAADRSRTITRQAEAKLEEAKWAAEARADAARDAARLPEAIETLANAEAWLVRCESTLEGLRSMQLRGADRRAAELRTTVDFYVDDVDEGHRARVASVEDDRLKLALANLPTDLKAAQDAQRLAATSLDACRKEVSRLEAQKTRAEGTDPVVAAREAHAAAAKYEEDVIGSFRQARAADEELRRSIVEQCARIGELANERAALDPLAEQAEGLVSAQARKVALEEKRASDMAELSAAEERIAAIDEAAIPTEQTPPDVAEAERLARDRVAAVAERCARVDSAQAFLTRAQESAALIEQLSTERAAIEVDLSDWTREANDLLSIIAMEVDGLGPQLTTIANDLLHTCVGPRWTVSIDTQRASADGKRTLETCEIRVLDTVEGIEKLGERLSGGQAVIVGEAIALAMAVVACAYWRVDGPTLVRDESGAALDPGMGPKYIAMLRRAAAQIGASRVLFVVHDRDAQALADARVVVAGGKVEVRV